MSNSFSEYETAIDFPTGLTNANNKCKVRLESHTSKAEDGASLFQFQQCQWVLISYY